MLNHKSEKTTGSIYGNQRYCPKCGGALKAVTTENTVNLKSKGSNQDFLQGSKMKSYRTQFSCSSCRLKFDIQDLRRIEMNKKLSDK